MPPKKSGESSTGGMAANTGTKRKFQETRHQAKSRSQTPNTAAAAPTAGNGTPSTQESSAAISFTPMNGTKSSGGIPAQNGSRSRNGATSSSESRDFKNEAAGENGEPVQANHHSQRKRSATAAPGSGELGSSNISDANSYEPVSKIPRRKRSSRFKEMDDMEPREPEADTVMLDAMTSTESIPAVSDSKKKGKLSLGKDIKKEKSMIPGIKTATKQSTLERHFRPLSQEKVLASDESSSKASKPENVESATESEPMMKTKLKIKLKVPSKVESQTVPPASFYGNPSPPGLPAPKSKGSRKSTNNGEIKETLVLTTNPPSSDTLSECFPSPTTIIESSETQPLITPIDANSSFSRGRRATRNAAPYYSGPPPFTIPTPTTNTPSSNSRNVSPSGSKSAKKTPRSPSPSKRGGKKSSAATTNPPNNNSTTTPVDNKVDPAAASNMANNMRRGGRSGRKLFDEFGELIDIEPPKQLPAYAPRAPSSCEYGMLPLGTLPPKERIDEIFNRNVPKEPESRNDMASSYPFSNLWGTVGNKDVTTLKGNQGRAKRLFQKAGKLDVDGEWVYPDTEGAKLVTVVDPDDMGPLSAGLLPPSRMRTKTPRLGSLSYPQENSASPSPSFPPDHPARSTEELLSPASENVPETPQETSVMNIDEPALQQTRRKSEAAFFVDDRLDIEAPGVSEVEDLIKEQTSKPPLLAVIRQAKAAAESAGNSEIVDLMNDLEAAGDTPQTRNLLNQILRGDVSRRRSPVTVPGNKRKLAQREDDEAEYEKAKRYRGPRHHLLRSFEPEVRLKRPDGQDKAIANHLYDVRMKGRARERELNKLYVPEDYTCLRDEPDESGKALYPAFRNRDFDADKKAADKEHQKKYKMALNPDRPSTPPNREPEPEVPQSGARGKRRKVVRERTHEPTSEEEADPGNADQLTDQMVDDDESPCTVCSGVGAPLVICDGPGCREEQHYDCADPPLTEEEVDAMPQWFCRSCSARKNYGRKGPEHKGLFGKLIERADKTNPRSFQLPKTLREHFSGVDTGELGEFKSSTDFYDLTRTKQKDLRAYDHLKIRNELPFEAQLLGPDGELALCYSCKESRIRTNRGELLACDYCTEYWHMDCLPEPLTDPPAIKAFGDKPNDQVVLAKWKCPLHIPDEVYPTRQARKPGEGRDPVWPPKHRERKPSPPPDPETSSLNWKQIHRNGKDRMLPLQGAKLSFLPGVNQARAQKELNEQTFTGIEVQVIEALRNMPLAGAAKTVQADAISPISPVQHPNGTNAIAELILSSLPMNLRAAAESSIASGAFDYDQQVQIEIMKGIKEVVESKLEALGAVGTFNI